MKVSPKILAFASNEEVCIHVTSAKHAVIVESRC